MAFTRISAVFAAAASVAVAQKAAVPSCAVLNVAYVNEKNPNINGGFSPNAGECQQVCASQPFACDVFTYYNDTQACWLIKANGTAVIEEKKVGAISGPQSCKGKTLKELLPEWKEKAVTESGKVVATLTDAVAKAKSSFLSSNSSTLSGLTNVTSFHDLKEQAKGMPWWGWAAVALGVACCGGTAVSAACCCCGQEKKAKRTRGVKLAAGPEAPKEEEVQLIPQPATTTYYVAPPIYTSVAPAQYVQAPPVVTAYTAAPVSTYAAAPVSTYAAAPVSTYAAAPVATYAAAPASYSYVQSSVPSEPVAYQTA